MIKSYALSADKVLYDLAQGALATAAGRPLASAVVLCSMGRLG
jgi:hypothetical protein